MPKDNTMTTINEDTIRQTAYQIWIDEGRPEGKADIHWLQAIATLEATAKPARKRAAPKKAAAAAKPAAAKKPAAKKTAKKVA